MFLARGQPLAQRILRIEKHFEKKNRYSQGMAKTIKKFTKWFFFRSGATVAHRCLFRKCRSLRESGCPLVFSFSQLQSFYFQSAIFSSMNRDLKKMCTHITMLVLISFFVFLKSALNFHWNFLLVLLAHRMIWRRI
jgi:hypothetical protein